MMAMTRDEQHDVYRRLLVYYDEVEALQWLSSPQKLLGGRTPIEAGYQEARRLLDQLDSGTYI